MRGVCYGPLPLSSRTLTSSRCSTQREQHYQRHQNIATLVKDILELDGIYIQYLRSLPRKRRWSTNNSDSDVLDDDEDTDDDLGSDEECTESSTTDCTEYDDPGPCEDPKPETRRERKAARRAARNKARFAGLTKDHIKRVEVVLHPNGNMIDEGPTPSDPLMNKTIKDNLAFNSRTFKYASLRTGVHQKKILKNSMAAKTIAQEKMQSQHAEITIFMQKLGIVDTNANSGPKNRRVLLTRLREGIKNDLECVANENKQHMIRMAGYWRYASKRTYNLMIEKNLVWDWETGAKLEVLDEEPEDSEEGTSDVSNDSPTDSYLGRSEHSDEATAGLTKNTITKGASPASIVTTETSPEALKCQNTSSESVVQKLRAQSPYSGKADARHLQAPVLLVTSSEKKDHVPVEAKAVMKENLPREKATMKVSEEFTGAAEEEEEAKDGPPSPLQAKLNRKKSKSRSKNKSLADQNNRFSALDGYVEEDWKTPKASQVDIAPVSNSRRSSVRSVAKPPATVRPSPLRNEVATSSQAPDLSAFPELPSTNAVKPKVKAPHPPARLTAQEAANFQTQLVTRRGLSTSARGGHGGEGGRGGRAAPVSYVDIARSGL